MLHRIRYRIIPFALLAALVLAASACVSAQYKEFKSLKDVKKEELVIVGKIILVPKLKKEEQKFNSGIFDNSDKAYRNKVYLLTGEKMRRVDSLNLELKDAGTMIPATFDEPFYVKGKNKPFVILTGMVQLREKIWLPGGLKVNAEPSDKAIYIGTVKYHRNEFFDITKAEIIDEFSNVRKEFQKRFGKGIPLKKRMVVLLKSEKKPGEQTKKK